MHQIVFNDISAAEVSAIPTLDQLELISSFQVDENTLSHITDDARFGLVERDGRKIYRFRSKDYRIYFTVEDGDKVIVQRVLHANSLKDFLFRSSIGGSEDQKLGGSRSFWKLIDEGEHAPRR
ncbi:MAG TPA: type II toxin-antitoxin system RelE/ParE family toxin [Candidatus Akkermansia intestinigallinarum]|uniref:Type II toxin-antitoxin system RelE/ParE family toxin n=1 Tax=Candidatus Akkermansia intestinigallinarum TaxID=2838431 RepID=A0A9D2AG46_9BACT|nr:type II toxin-antitoxin system RelE/ParE family toxin [Candidatus Akkermansia intestinigallinarum]